MSCLPSATLLDIVALQEFLGRALDWSQFQGKRLRVSSFRVEIGNKDDTLHCQKVVCVADYYGVFKPEWWLRIPLASVRRWFNRRKHTKLRERQ